MILAEIKMNNQESIFSVDSLPESLLINDYETYQKLNKAIEEMKAKNDSWNGHVGYNGKTYFKITKVSVNPERYNKFIETYENFLFAEWKANPLVYIKGYEGTCRVMRHAIAKGDYSKDSETFKQTCKALRIKYTYKAINEFLKGS